jgi:hypothetical protein
MISLHHGSYDVNKLDLPKLTIWVQCSNRIYAEIKNIDPAGVEARRYDLQRKKGSYECDGPDHIWHIDGHMKLVDFGIEIYAAIDGYSRRIIWIYVGISARTEVSVEKQYLKAVGELERLPKKLRSDRGSETPAMATAHWQLRADGSYNMALIEAYIFGTSTDNVRIEGWWGQWSKARGWSWRVR